MLLNEFMYFNKTFEQDDEFEDDMIDDKRYDPKSDEHRIKLDDTRKTRLTLKHINQMRRNYEAHMQEMAEETELIQAQYATPVQPAE